jgi:hypothetical protein
MKIANTTTGVLMLQLMLKRISKHLERRRHKRTLTNLSAEISVQVRKGEVSKNHVLPVNVVDLSLKGCSFITNTVVIDGKHLFLEDIGSKQIQIKIHLPNHSIHSHTKVIWFDIAEGHRGFKVGLNFESMKDTNKDILKKYLLSSKPNTPDK